MTTYRLSRIVAFRDYSEEGFVSSTGDDMLETIAYRRSVPIEGLEQPNLTETRGNTLSLYTSIKSRSQFTIQMLGNNMARFE